jgi:xanthine dehydrogenase accessory factor
MSDASRVVPRAAAPEEVLRAATVALARGASVALATVVERQGSAPSTPGQKLAIHLGSSPEVGPVRSVEALGTIGGGAVEHAVVKALLDALETDSFEPKLETFRLGPSLGMCCGGSVRVLLEVLRPGACVLLVGAGHVGRATARLLEETGFRVVVVDARAEAATALAALLEGRSHATVLHADHDDPEVLAALGGEPSRCDCVVMTHDHQLDQRVIEWAIARGFRFVGGVGSRAKAERTRQRLEAKGVAEAEWRRVKMPVGLAIGARTPEEIAVSIVGELIERRSSREGRARRGRTEEHRTEDQAARVEASLAEATATSIDTSESIGATGEVVAVEALVS